MATGPPPTCRPSNWLSVAGRKHPKSATEQAAKSLLDAAHAMPRLEMLSTLFLHLPQYPAALPVSDPEQGQGHRGIHRHSLATNESVSMQAQLPIDAPKVTFSIPPHSTVDQSLDANDLQQLGERLRLTYGPVETSLPARLAELVERLARREQTEG
jgi:hypothetical protein